MHYVENDPVLTRIVSRLDKMSCAEAIILDAAFLKPFVRLAARVGRAKVLSHINTPSLTPEMGVYVNVSVLT